MLTIRFHPPIRPSRRPHGWSLVEMLIAVGASTLILASLMVTMLFVMTNFKAMGNYGELNQSSRYTLDVMNRDIRNAAKVTAEGTYNITMTNMDGDQFSYNYDTTSQTLTRYFTNSAGTMASRILLTNCDAFAFSFFTRVPSATAPGPLFITNSTGDSTQTKLIYVDWKCSRTIMGAKANTESVQTAQIAIRN